METFRCESINGNIYYLTEEEIKRRNRLGLAVLVIMCISIGAILLYTNTTL